MDWVNGKHGGGWKEGQWVEREKGDHLRVVSENLEMREKKSMDEVQVRFWIHGDVRERNLIWRICVKFLNCQNLCMKSICVNCENPGLGELLKILKKKQLRVWVLFRLDWFSKALNKRVIWYINVSWSLTTNLHCLKWSNTKCLVSVPSCHLKSLILCLYIHLSLLLENQEKTPYMKRFWNLLLMQYPHDYSHESLLWEQRE